MSERFHYSTTLTFNPERADYAEIDVTVSFEVSWGLPSGMTDPATDDEVSDIQLVKVGDKFRPWGFHWWSDGHFADLVAERLFDSEADLERMLEIAAEDAVCVEDEIAERRWEDRRDGFAA